MVEHLSNGGRSLLAAAWTDEPAKARTFHYNLAVSVARRNGCEVILAKPKGQ
jgi:hypothetical protein